MLKFCENCFEHSTENKLFDKGFMPYLDENNYICPNCGNKTKDVIPEKDYILILKISTDPKFIKAMIDLNEKDPIEYQLKMATIRNQIQQQKQVKSQEKARNTLKCPRCGSTAITTGARGANHFWGLIGASKTVNRCGSCGYTWEPRR